MRYFTLFLLLILTQEVNPEKDVDNKCSSYSALNSSLDYKGQNFYHLESIYSSKYLPTANTVKGLWHFNEGTGDTAYDASASGNNGALKPAGSQPTWVTARFGYGVSCDNVDDYVHISTSDFNKVEGTIEMWLKPVWSGNDGKVHFIYDNGKVTDADWEDSFADSSLIDTVLSSNIAISSGDASLDKNQEEFEADVFTDGFENAGDTVFTESFENEGDTMLTEGFDDRGDTTFSTGFENAGNIDSFDTGGSTNWYRTDAQAYAGTYSARSGALGYTQESWIEKTITGPATIIFYWKTVSSSSSNILQLQVDGDVKLSCSGNTVWTQQVYTVSSGSHTVKWRYYRGSPFNSGTAYLDEILITNQGMGTGWTTGGNKEWFATDDNFHNGIQSARSGILDDNGEQSWIQRDIEGPSTIFWWWNTVSSSSSNELEFRVDDDVKVSTSGNTAWEQQQYAISSGLHTVKWRYYRGSHFNDGIAYLDEILMTNQGLGTGWTTGGNKEWFATDDDAQSGSQSAQSGELSDDDHESWIEKTIDGPATVYFYWKTASSSSSNILQFQVDGDVKLSCSENTAWEQKQFTVSSGTHTLKWRYYRGSHFNSGTAYLDNVIITSQGFSGGWTTGGNEDWFATDDDFHNGTQSARSGDLDDNGEQSWIQRDIEGPSTVFWWWETVSSSSSNELEFQVDGDVKLSCSGNTTWEQQQYAVGSGSHTVKWRYYRGSHFNSGTGYIDDIRIESQALSGWTTGGGAEWGTDNSEWYSGEWSAKSGNISDNDTSFIKRMDVEGPTTLTFWWKGSSAAGDSLYFFVDGSRVYAISGVVSWEQKSSAIASGTHTVEWAYIKDGSGDGGSDCGWIDLIEWGHKSSGTLVSKKITPTRFLAWDKFYMQNTVTDGSVSYEIWDEDYTSKLMDVSYGTDIYGISDTVIRIKASLASSANHSSAPTVHSWKADYLYAQTEGPVLYKSCDSLLVYRIGNCKISTDVSGWSGDVMRHIAFTWHGNTPRRTKLYLDGVMADSSTAADAFTYPDSLPTVGKIGGIVHNATQRYSAQGIIDEVRVLNYARESFNPGVVINEVCYWPITGNKQWIELYNGGGRDISCCDWEFKDADGNLYKVPASGSAYTLSPGEFVLIELSNTGTDSDSKWYTCNGGTGTTMAPNDLNGTGNSGGDRLYVYLNSTHDYKNVIDFVGWGDGGGSKALDTEADAAGLWDMDAGNPYVVDAGENYEYGGEQMYEGVTIGVGGDGNNEEGKPDWKAFHSPGTPGSSNGGGAPLAVELVSFDAQAGYKEVLLSWLTEVEIDNKKWLIGRSNQAIELSSNEYEIIAEIPVKGVGDNYIYTDSFVKGGITYWYLLGDISGQGDTTWHYDLIARATPKAYKIFKFALHQNYPSPFRNRTTIKYTVPGKLPATINPRVSLKIYDLSGRVVRTIVDMEKAPGNYLVKWDGKSDRGKLLPTGVYFYSLKCSDKRTTRKLLLIK